MVVADVITFFSNSFQCALVLIGGCIYRGEVKRELMSNALCQGFVIADWYDAPGLYMCWLSITKTDQSFCEWHEARMKSLPTAMLLLQYFPVSVLALRVLYTFKMTFKKEFQRLLRIKPKLLRAFSWEKWFSGLDNWALWTQTSSYNAE